MTRHGGRSRREELTLIDNATIGKLYSLVEEARLLLWREIIVSEEPLPIGEGELPYTVEKIENGYKVVIRDILPRNKEFVKRISLQTAWFGTLNKAFAKIDRKFERLLVIIVPYLPLNNVWDVDNRPYKFIIDMCRYTKLIPNDSWEYLSFMVVGKVDAANPRTEIYLTELPITGEIKVPYLGS